MICEPVQVSVVAEWPNGLGFTCVVNGQMFEVGADRKLGRLTAWVMNPNGDYHAFTEIVSRGGEWVAGNVATAELVFMCWRDKIGAWNVAE